MMDSNIEFPLLEKFVLDDYGINLKMYKSRQLTRRIGNFMSKVNANNEKEMVDILKKDPTISEKFRDFLTINVSEFFRNKEMFIELASVVKQQLRPESKKLKVWSAACSNGCEPYTLAMMFEDISPKQTHDILGTDIDINILEAAKRGMYIYNDIKNIDKATLDRYFKLDENGKYWIDSSIKNKVRFKKHDLTADNYESDFDLIVCRNVVIYFTEEAKNLIYHKFSESLKTGGLLFVGATECIYKYQDFGFEKVSSFIYRKK